MGDTLIILYFIFAAFVFLLVTGGYNDMIQHELDKAKVRQKWKYREMNETDHE